MRQFLQILEHETNYFILHFCVLWHQSTAFLLGANWNVSNLLVIIRKLIYVLSVVKVGPLKPGSFVVAAC